jgi:hypothetical protein
MASSPLASVSSLSTIQFTRDHFYPLVIRPELVDEKTPLLELIIMVKNGGPEFQSIFLQNISWVDEWSALDTGSTDGTWEWLVDMQKQNPTHPLEKKHVYQEPFVAFHTSRNRLLDLTQDHSCTFQIMLDDTYLLKNGATLREFLKWARTAEFNPKICESFALFIEDDSKHAFNLNGQIINDSNQVKYLSNRILYTHHKLRYDPRYSVHEIIQKNNTVSLPFEYGSIFDVRSDKMYDRTKNRKRQDLENLLKDHEKYPTNLRIMYYIAETYLNMEDYKNAAYWYGRRADDPPTNEDYDEERYDAKYKFAVMHHYHLGAKWEQVVSLYMKTHAFLPNRPEALFMLGYYFTQPESSVPDLAYTFLRRCFQIGPPKGGMNLKMYQHDTLLPELLAPLCLQFEDYELGQKVTAHKNTYKMRTIHNICRNMLSLHQTNITCPFLGSPKKWIAFVTWSGWAPYNGMTLRTKGLGGSETCIIRFAEEIAASQHEKYQPVIFCPCDTPKTYINGVYYLNITDYLPFLTSRKEEIHRVFLQRSSDLILPTVSQNVKCYLHLHDTLPQDEILVGFKNPAFLGVICLSEWHKKLVESAFGHLKIPIFVQSYGIDVSEIPLDVDLYQMYTTQLFRKKRKHSFIYPSFPNRGLRVLLEMWPKILDMWPDAQLHIFCDFQNAWLQQFSEEMQIIQEKIKQFAASVKNHGWQNPNYLKKFWQQSQIWLYPCTFAETFCLTALEARVHQLHIITCDLAALPETLGRDGKIIPGNPQTQEWQDQALAHLKQLDTDTPHHNNWAQLQGRSYARQVAKFVQHFVE